MTRMIDGEVSVSLKWSQSSPRFVAPLTQFEIWKHALQMSEVPTYYLRTQNLEPKQETQTHFFAPVTLTLMYELCLDIL